ncbi:phosphomevalonate kinase [Stylonychia lemnae]|uniref:phosphomevalonate kinase n=1 Tax=Stylonychia lemnae TaxID=5949 RepID=A0A078ADX2_STYLE|nr:phosphomevalonate kinase [Stylonychia lemnae]|eukprot:CDW80405.1 phosphomevalonate kinase [Stylonychia lemnae]
MIIQAESLFSPKQILSQADWLVCNKESGQTLVPKDGYCMISMTMQDIYPRETSNFVFGYASLSNRTGVFSFKRYDPEYQGLQDPNREITLLRNACGVMVHETAHMFGLKHCIYYNCTMNGSNSYEESTRFLRNIKQSQIVKTISASTCSKVLVTGAYLILDPKYEGIVLATDARFHCKINQSMAEVDKDFKFIINSPQFNKVIRVQVQKGENDQEQFDIKPDDQFIGKCMYFLLQLIKLREIEINDNQYEITLIGDNSFYSQRDKFIDDFNYNSLSKQILCDNPVDPHKKTGLGSSAALITSFLASTLQLFQIIDIQSTKDHDLKLLHIYSQILNAFVQEKVGSGFDIACSIYGSQIYRRFTNVKDLNDIVQKLMSNYQKGIICQDLELNQLIQTFENNFDYEHKVFTLNPLLDLCLIDVDSGSDTKVMVRQVLDWAKRQQQDPSDQFSNELFQALNHNYQTLAENLMIENLTIQNKLDIKNKCFEIRSLIQQISKETEVAIEPSEQTKMLDQILSSLDQVYYSAVPGAGGDDAIFILGERENLHQLIQQEFCDTYQDKKISVLPVKVLKTQALMIQQSL